MKNQEKLQRFENGLERFSTQELRESVDYMVELDLSHEEEIIFDSVVKELGKRSINERIKEKHYIN